MQGLGSGVRQLIAKGLGFGLWGCRIAGFGALLGLSVHVHRGLDATSHQLLAHDERQQKLEHAPAMPQTLRPAAVHTGAKHRPWKGRLPILDLHGDLAQGLLYVEDMYEILRP